MFKNTEKFKILVKTGCQERAGTDANVFVTIEDDKGVKAPALKLDILLYNDLERGTLDSYTQTISPSFGKATRIYVSRDTQGRGDDWFCDYIIVQDPRGSPNKSFRKIKNYQTPGICTQSHNGYFAETYFPICRWIRAKQEYTFGKFGTVLPAEDANKKVRAFDLQEKKKTYLYVLNIPSGPAQTAILPGDEKFSDEYYWSFAKEKLALLAKTKFIMWTTQKWKSFPALKSVLTKSLGDPECSSVWDTDEWFGLQRLQGLNPFVLKHCVEIPEKLDVTEETVSGLLGDLSLKEALEQNKLFICDLDILDGVVCKDNRKMGAPIALFYLKSPDLLLPIAIQLYQQKGPLNPVFTPKDPHNTWLVAKMYYNNCEAQHHQGVTHLGYTHLLMEGVCVCSHRNLSPSHPVFKLMAPHFLFLLAINSRGLEKLISKGGWVDGCMTQGIEGIYEVIRRGFQRHNFSSYGNVEAEIKSRGLLDPEILPYYPYRDDAISLFKIIREYVAKVINHYYDTKEKLTGDWELREWRQELSIPREKGGVGMVGVPGNDIKGFADVEELIETVAIIISTCSLGHAAANFQQYEQYGFVPNYPGILMRDPPTKKINYTESEILEILPDMKTTLDTMVITKLLSNRGTNSLGDFEMQYLYHPTDVQAADEFRKELKKLSLEVKKRNIDRRHPFLWLDPETVPNAISI